MQLAVYSSLAKNLLRRPHMQRLHIYPTSVIPDDVKANITGQIRPLKAVPKRLTEYTKEEIDAFPKVYDYPKDYILK